MFGVFLHDTWECLPEIPRASTTIPICCNCLLSLFNWICVLGNFQVSVLCTLQKLKEGQQQQRQMLETLLSKVGVDQHGDDDLREPFSNPLDTMGDFDELADQLADADFNKRMVRPYNNMHKMDKSKIFTYSGSHLGMYVHTPLVELLRPTAETPLLVCLRPPAQNFN